MTSKYMMLTEKCSTLYITEKQKEIARDQRDLDNLQVELNKVARSAMDTLRDMDWLAEDDLKALGYRTIGDAFRGTFSYYRKLMDALIAAHIRKYPD